jgi:hypothetical protein
MSAVKHDPRQPDVFRWHKADGSLRVRTMSVFEGIVLQNSLQATGFPQ